MCCNLCSLLFKSKCAEYGQLLPFILRKTSTILYIKSILTTLLLTMQFCFKILFRQVDEVIKQCTLYLVKGKKDGLFNYILWYTLYCKSHNKPWQMYCTAQHGKQPIYRTVVEEEDILYLKRLNFAPADNLVTHAIPKIYRGYNTRHIIFGLLFE